jgi:hypothetical protein
MAEMVRRSAREMRWRMGVASSRGLVDEKVAAVGRGRHCKHIYVKPIGQD